MYSVWGEALVGVIFLLWLIILTFLFFRERKFLHQLFPKNESRDIRLKFNELLDEIKRFGESEKELQARVKRVASEGLTHVQKVAVLRYNPYSDTGGDQSFSMVLLDGKLNGVLLTSLHNRAGTRIYTKVIKAGKSDLDLSKEEKAVLEQVTI